MERGIKRRRRSRRRRERERERERCVCVCMMREGRISNVPMAAHRNPVPLRYPMLRLEDGADLIPEWSMVQFQLTNDEWSSDSRTATSPVALRHDRIRQEAKSCEFSPSLLLLKMIFGHAPQILPGQWGIKSTRTDRDQWRTSARDSIRIRRIHCLWSGLPPLLLLSLFVTFSVRHLLCLVFRCHQNCRQGCRRSLY